MPANRRARMEAARSQEQRCHFEQSGDESFLMPYCWGGLMYGLDACYCSTESAAGDKPSYEILEQRIARLEEDLQEIRTWLNESIERAC